MLRVNNKVATHIRVMMDYCIEHGIEIDTIILSEYYFILFNNLFKNSDEVEVIHKTNSSMLFNYKGVDIKLLLGNFTTDEQHKVDFLRIHTVTDTYLIKDFYFKLK